MAMAAPRCSSYMYGSLGLTIRRGGVIKMKSLKSISLYDFDGAKRLGRDSRLMLPL
jgi:hypothetical protein